MARSRRRARAFSLFAFQDIITSVTAIMILIVLILTLEVVMRSRMTAVAEDHKAVVQELETAIARLERQIAATRKQVAATQQIAATVVGVDITALSGAVAAERERDLETAAALRAAEDTALAAKEERREVDSLGAQAARQERARRQAELDRLTPLISELEEECRGLAARQSRKAAPGPAVVLAALEFNPAEGRKRPVVIDVTGAGVAVADAVGAPLRALGWGLSGPPAGLTGWLRSRDAAAESVVIVVRPSGVARYDAVREAVVRAGLDVGTELVGEQTRIVASRAGAP